jgi:hypothetical protein
MSRAEPNEYHEQGRGKKVLRGIICRCLRTLVWISWSTAASIPSGIEGKKLR